MTLNLSEAERLQRMIDTITEQRRTLLQRMNDQYSLTKELPIEILSTIFQLACQKSEFQNLDPHSNFIDNSSSVSPFILTSVSTHWRRVVESIPQLWTCVEMEVTEFNIRKVVHVLRCYMNNCGNLGVSINLDFFKQTAINYQTRESTLLYITDVVWLAAGWSCGAEEPLEPIRNLIFYEYSDKIKALRLVSPPPEWIGCEAMPRFKQWERFTRLRVLHFSWEDCSSMKVTHGRLVGLEDAPELQQVRLCEIPDFRFYISNAIIWRFDQITEFHLSQINYHICLDLLFKCRNLRFCSMLRPVCNERGEALPKFDGGVKFPKQLEILEWTFPNGWLDTVTPYSFRDIPSFHAPQSSQIVHTIILHDIFNIECAPAVGLQFFFSILPPSCKSLTLGTQAHFINQERLRSMIRCIQLVPKTVVYLAFTTECIYLQQMMYEGFEEEDNDSGGELGTLTINNISKFSIVFHKQCATRKILGKRIQRDCLGSPLKVSKFLKAMELKKKIWDQVGQGTDMKFCFEYDTDCIHVTWSDDVKKGLKKLVDDGFDLEIIGNGKCVDWIH